MIEEKLLGAAVRKFREARGLTQRELSDKTGLTINYLSLLENSHRGASIPILNRIAKALDVHPILFYVLSYPLDEKEEDDSGLHSIIHAYQKMAQEYIQSLG